MTTILNRLRDAAKTGRPVAQVALEIAARRDMLPTSLGSAEIRQQFSRELRGKSVFSARTTNATYLQGLRDAVDLLLAGGFQNDQPQLRLELKTLITRLGYTPETGFPGDADLDIPPAKPGSLQDLSSDKRINFILDTQQRLARGASLKLRGNDPARVEGWPAWELVRVITREVPRGTPLSGTKGWGRRWAEAGGPIVEGGRLVAWKDDPVWAKLGDPELFDDALGVDHPPFAFQSGMGWREVRAEEARELLGDRPDGSDRPDKAENLLPEPRTGTRDLDPDLVAALAESIRARRERQGGGSVALRYQKLLEAETSAAKADYLARNN